jgi:tetratricopeptide (TPR) repeat protein
MNFCHSIQISRIGDIEKYNRLINVNLLIIISLLLLVMSGCTTTIKKTEAVLEPEVVNLPEPEIQNKQPLDDLIEDSVTVIPPPEDKHFVSTPVVQGLLKKSRNKFEAREFEAAANFLERGINIAPNDPMLWQRLAAIRFEQGNYKQAKQLAKKSNILVESDKTLREINNDIINQVNRLIESQ